MEALIELLPLLFLGGYYLLTNRRKAQKRQQATQTPLVGEAGPEKSTSGPTPFETFLANLEESLAQAGGAQPEAEPAPLLPPERESVIPEAPPTARTVPSLGSEFSAMAGSFDAPQPVDHDAHGFGAENPFSEEIFERAPAFSEPTRRSADYDPHGLRRSPPRKIASVNWNARLSDPVAARDAFVLRTVFGKRGGHKNDRRR